MDTSDFAFPKPQDVAREPEPVHVFPDGREVCNFLTTSGRSEYRRRLTVAWKLQRGMCGICHGYVRLGDASADHVLTRGMGGGRRDDRQENIRATHLWCNSERGSKRKGYYGQR